MAAELAATLVATEEDRLLQAEGIVRDYCRWHIAPVREDVELELKPSYGPILTLPSLYVTAVAVTENDVPLIAGTDFDWEENGVLTRAGCWFQKVVVTFTHGYAAVPPGVQAIVQSVAQRGVDNPGSLVRKQAGPFADTYSQTGFNQSLPIALLDAEQKILDHYRIPPRP